MVDADLVNFVAVREISTPLADRFAAVSHDPRHMPGYIYITLRPTRVQVRNGYHEFGGRTVMSDHEWLTEPID